MTQGGGRMGAGEIRCSRCKERITEGEKVWEVRLCHMKDGAFKPERSLHYLCERCSRLMARMIPTPAGDEVEEPEPVIVVRRGVTAMEDVRNWSYPEENAGTIFEGKDDEDRGFRLTIFYPDLVRVVGWLERWIRWQRKMLDEGR